MHPAVRTQADGEQDLFSAASVLDCAAEGNLDTARQEFKQEADINVLLQRFGINAPQKQVTFQDVDFDLDLQTALAAIATARAVHRSLPPELRADFPTWQALLTAVDRGEVTISDKPPEVPAPKPST